MNATTPSPTTRTTSSPKTPDSARRHYLTQVVRKRAELTKARADGVDEAGFAEIAEVLADAKEMARRARSWGQRSASRARLAPQAPVGNAARKRARLARTAPLTARDTEIQIGTGSVRDPYDPNATISASVNRRVDVLAAERAAERITKAQFQVERMIQAVYERASGARLKSVSWATEGTSDKSTAHELAMIYGLNDANRILRFTARLERAVGSVGVRFLRAILTEGQTFHSYSAARGKGGERGAGQVAAHFRFLLEGLTEAQHTARGSAGARVRDGYADQTDAVADRLVRSAALAAEQARAEAAE